MIKINCGDVTNPKTGVKKEIVVKTLAPNSIKNVLIGGGLVFVGVAYLTLNAFKNGVKKHEIAEIKALKSADLLKENSK